MATSGTKERHHQSSCGDDKMLQDKKNTSIELIKEKMKEKRRQKARNDSMLSRSFSKRKGATPLVILKSSLRSNNESLAKALATSRHNAQLAHHNIMELQQDRQILQQHVNMTRTAEKECIKRFRSIKQVLTNVTTSLLDTVTSLSQALDLCSSLPIRDSSMVIVPRSSTSSDDDSFGIVQKTVHGACMYNRKAEMISSAIESAASEIIQAASLATVTIDQSVPITDTNQSQPSSGHNKSEQPLDGCDQPIELKDFDSDVEFPSLDVDFPMRFTEESPDSKVVGRCGSRRRQSCRLNPPEKHPRTAAMLDPDTIQKALAGDEENTYSEYSSQIDQTPSPQPKSQSEHVSNTAAHSVSPATKVQSHNKNGSAIRTDKGPDARTRRATYNITPAKSESPANRTFEALDPQEYPVVSNWPELGIKKRYVFVHSPPCKSSNYKTLDMDLTGVTNNSSSASQEEHSKSLANKSRFNHDDQVIRPWGNIQPDNSSAAAVSKIETKAKPLTNASKSKLPKPQKKVSSKPGVGHSSIHLSKISKECKKASKRSKKAVVTSELAKNDPAVFDLSAGESFSVPSPILKRIKAKPSNTLAGLATCINPHKDQGVNDCVIEEPLGELQMTCHGKQDEHSLPVTNEKQHGPVQQEEKLDPIHQGKHPDHMQKVEQSDLIHLKEHLDPMKEHLDPMKEHLDPMKEHLDPMHQVEPKTAVRGGKIKRKSKKARCIVTPCIDKAAAVSRKTKLSVITAQCDGVDNDNFDGTYLGDQQFRPDEKQPSCAAKVAEDIDDTAKVLESVKDQNQHSNKEKQKAKAAKPPRTKLVRDDVETELNLPEDTGDIPSLQAPSTDTVKPFVTFENPEASRNHICDNHPPSNILGDIEDDLCIKKKGPSSRGRSCTKESVHRGSSKSPSVIASSIPKESELGCKPSTSTVDINCRKSSLKKRTKDKGSSHESKRGKKRMADALEEEAAALGRREEVGTEEAGRRSRRAVRVCYKEPALNCKMRSEHSPERQKKTTNKRGNKRTALGTVTNVHVQ